MIRSQNQSLSFPSSEKIALYIYCLQYSSSPHHGATTACRIWCAELVANRHPRSLASRSRTSLCSGRRKRYDRGCASLCCWYAKVLQRCTVKLKNQGTRAKRISSSADFKDYMDVRHLRYSGIGWSKADTNIPETLQYVRKHARISGGSESAILVCQRWLERVSLN